MAGGLECANLHDLLEALVVGCVAAIHCVAAFRLFVEMGRRVGPRDA